MDLIPIQLNYPKEVFFFGAGTSVLAGVPTFADFYKKAEIVYQNKKNEIDVELFKRVLEYWKKGFVECNIEDFYSAVEMREMLDDTFSAKETVTTDEIENFIYATIKKSIYNNPNLNTYALFHSKSMANSVIITTNWDILLETTWQYNIEDGYISYEFVLPHSTIKRSDYFDRINVKIRILKLHGSLNWGFCEKCGKIYYFNEKVDEELSKKNVSCDNYSCDGKLARIIIPPKLSKLIKPESDTESTLLKSPYFQLRSIWSRASKYLEMCERIYFIGYSFPETDVQMKTFISNALRENKTLKEVRIISNKKHGNSRFEFEERYLSILSRFISHSQIDFYYEGFEEFCNELEEYNMRNP